MNTLLNCEDVFETLTAGPIVNGSAAANALGEHLDGCDECRRLADAFRPATHLIHEAMSFEQQAELPSYSPDDEFVSRIMSQLDVLPSDTPATDLLATDATPKRRLRLASLGFCVAVAVLILSLWRPIPADPTGLSRTNLDSLHLPSACVDFTVAETNDATSAAATEPEHKVAYLCCTSCHAASSQSEMNMSENMSQLIAACSSCH